MIPPIRRCLADALTVALVLISASAAAQPAAWPSEPIRMIVGYPPGGGSDGVARMAADILAASLGQRVLVDNRPGAGGVIAAEAVARAKPDGHTLLAAPGQMATNPSLRKSLPFNTLKDLVPVARVAILPLAIAVNPRVPARTITELAEYSKSNPVTCASASVGTIGHLTCMLVNLRLGGRIVHVGYKGSAPALNDTVGGQVDALFDTLTTALPHAKTGRLRMISVNSAKRHPSAPDVPTAAEAGLPGFSAETWVGVFAPAGTPPEVIRRINRDLIEAVNRPAYRERLAALGMDPGSGTAEQFADEFAREVAMWGDVVRQSGVVVEN